MAKAKKKAAKKKGRIKSAATGKYTRGGSAETTYREAREVVIGRGFAIRKTDGTYLAQDTGPGSVHPTFPGVYKEEGRAKRNTVSGERVLPVRLVLDRR